MNTLTQPNHSPIFKLNASQKLINFAFKQLYKRLIAAYGTPIKSKQTREGRTVHVNEMMLVALLAEDMLVVHEPKLSAFYTYSEETGLWSSITEAKLKLHFDDLIRRAADELDISDNEVIDLCNNRKYADLISILKGYVEDSEIFMKRKTAIHLGNGMLKWENKGFTLTSYHPLYYSRNRCLLEFKPGAECPRFMEFITWALPIKEDLEILQMLAGQWLLGQNIMQKIVIFRGKAKTGKSTLMSIFREIVGRVNTTELRTRHLDERFEMNNYFNKSLLIGADVPGDFLCKKGSEALKKLTGDDLISVERKYGADMREIIGNFNVGITTNSRLRVGLDNDADAWRRRLVIFDFITKPAEKSISGYAEILVAEEGTGILRWMVEGAALLLELNDREQGLPTSPVQMKRVDDILSESDSLTHFVRNKLKVGDGTLTTSEIIELYFEECNSNGWTPLQNAERQLRSMIEEAHGVTQSHNILRNGNSLRGYRNLTTA